VSHLQYSGSTANSDHGTPPRTTPATNHSYGDTQRVGDGEAGALNGGRDVDGAIHEDVLTVTETTLR
jgi:hypothetical protein